MIETVTKTQDNVQVLLTFTQAAHRLNVCKRTVQYWIELGLLTPFPHIRGRIAVVEVDRFAKEQSDKARQERFRKRFDRKPTNHQTTCY